MSFITFEFAILFSITFIFLILVKSTVGRKLILLSASLIFYAAWDWRFLGLLVLMTLVVHKLTLSLDKAKDKNRKKLIFIVTIVFILSILLFFKYFNFFIDNINLFFTLFGWKISSINIILPIGISFYTFEILGYVFDNYRGVALPAKSLLDFAVFITFFPNLISGPIMRANQFLPQMERGVQINFPYFIEGLQKFLQGLIKKIVVADSLLIMVDQIFYLPSSFSSATVWLGVLAYSVQIFCDFSGYIDMATGISKMIGIDLQRNFDLPFTAQSISDFWRRWNITLSSWFRDYLFMPLELKRRKVKYFRVQTNIMIVFLLTGLWHGATWNFVLWGGLHGVYLIVERLISRGRPIPTKWTSPLSWFRALFTYFWILIALVFFRSPGLHTTGLIFSKLFFLSPTGIEWFYQSAVFFVPLFILGGWIYRSIENRIQMPIISYPVQFSLMALEILFIYFFASLTTSPFVYFQF
jgi:alginate O-acetyltransferase complex protein AlgI